jgi:hypothetical protein
LYRAFRHLERSKWFFQYSPACFRLEIGTSAPGCSRGEPPSCIWIRGVEDATTLPEHLVTKQVLDCMKIKNRHAPVGGRL